MTSAPDRPARRVGPERVGKRGRWVLLAVLVLLPVLSWQFGFRGGWIAEAEPVRRGLVQVEQCRPTILPAIGYTCRGPVTWTLEASPGDARGTRLTDSAVVEVFSPRTHTGQLEVVSRIWGGAGKGGTKYHEVILPASAAATAPWWAQAIDVAAIAMLLLVIGSIVGSALRLRRQSAPVG